MKKHTAFCFDLDGTITKEEILPLLSKELNLYDEMNALTMATINGLIPFDSSFKLRTMILSAVPISKIQDIILNVKLHNNILEFMQENRDDCYIITGNLDIWLSKLINHLELNCFSSIADWSDNKLIGIKKILNKGDAVDEIRKKGFERIVAVGDGMGDVSMFNKSDISIAFGGVHQPVKTLIELSDIVLFREKSLCRTLNTLL